MKPPRQGEGAIFRTRVEQRPRFDGACDPQTPKARKTDGHLVPTLAGFAEVERSASEIRVAAS